MSVTLPVELASCDRQPRVAFGVHDVLQRGPHVEMEACACDCDEWPLAMKLKPIKGGF